MPDYLLPDGQPAPWVAYQTLSEPPLVDPRVVFDRFLTNSFCPTGPGGGIDPSCSPGSVGGTAGLTVKLPKTAKEAGQAMADALAHVKPDVAADPGLREKVAKNWAKELRGKVISRGTDYDTLKAGMQENLANKDFAEVVAVRGPQAVVLLKGEGMNRRAESVGATTLVYSHSIEPLEKATAPPKPGVATSEEGGGVAAVLRHEYAHRIYTSQMSAAEQEQWMAKAKSLYQDSADLKKELTVYAGRSSNREEWFSEAFAVGTAPGYNPGQFSERARSLIDSTLAAAKGGTTTH